MPSSHCSPGPTRPSPQIASLHACVHARSGPLPQPRSHSSPASTTPSPQVVCAATHIFVTVTKRATLWNRLSLYALAAIRIGPSPSVVTFAVADHWPFAHVAVPLASPPIRTTLPGTVHVPATAIVSCTTADIADIVIS